MQPNQQSSAFYSTGGTVGFTTAPETPDSLRKRAKDMERAAKYVKREAKKQCKQRQVAIDALKRVAKDTKRGYACVEAARELLRIDEVA